MSEVCPKRRNIDNIMNRFTGEARMGRKQLLICFASRKPGQERLDGNMENACAFSTIRKTTT